MDWQDVFSLIIFLLLAAFSKKRKPAEEGKEAIPEEPVFSDVDTVRKKIEVLKQQRIQASNVNSKPHEAPKKERPIFSAYKHLPKEEIVEEFQASEAVSEVSVVGKQKDITKSVDLPRKKSRLRDWVVGQVILGTPAYRRYGNFIHR